MKTKESGSISNFGLSLLKKYSEAQTLEVPPLPTSPTLYQMIGCYYKHARSFKPTTTQRDYVDIEVGAGDC